MGYKSQIDAALFLGVRVETLEYFVKKSPKSGEQRKLKSIKSETGAIFDEDELAAFDAYLSEPWPLTAGATRPHIPKAIKDDVKDECHHSCAICGSMDNGEVAHIEAVASKLNNAPRNLVVLCPNHHTKYDLGFKPSSNITDVEIRAAKRLKGNARVRMMKFEAFTVRMLESMVAAVKRLDKDISEAATENLRSIYVSELGTMLRAIPNLMAKAKLAASTDQSSSQAEEEIAKLAPKLTALAANGSGATAKPQQIRSSANAIVTEVEDILGDLDEVECPHCAGRGLSGLVGDFCRFCRGSCFVSTEKSASYNAAEIDEAACPRCDGAGTVGLASDLCPYCRGSCNVTREQANEYDPTALDEVDCPHCCGRGVTGLSGDFCAYCKGSCTITHAKLAAYDRSAIDEVNCPHCNGRGLTGLAGDFCMYCRGTCVVSHAKQDEYDPKQLDEVNCPHCGGRGQTGIAGDTCSYCKGSCVVTNTRFAAYSPASIDEVECPRCAGRGTTGYQGDTCALCKGSCFVTGAKANAYIRKHRD